MKKFLAAVVFAFAVGGCSSGEYTPPPAPVDSAKVDTTKHESHGDSTKHEGKHEGHDGQHGEHGKSK